jgi:ABC-type glycerol-3-phosphate transport system permease component
MTIRTHLLRAAFYATAILVSALFVYPYFWMVLSSVRGTEEAMVAPLRLWPERLNLNAYIDIAQVGGIPLGRFLWNSLLVTVASTAVAVVVTALAAYALNRRPRLPGMRALRYGFLLTIMYPYMLLLIPVYLVMHQLGLLGSTAGLVLFLSLGPVQFFLFDQFFRSIPRELIEAALVDGASELQVLWRVVMPIARSVVATVTLITFLINWAQWFPVIVIANQPQSYTLPAALLMLNTELGVSYQSILAMATITTLPVVVVFLLTQRRVMEGFAAGAVKG